MDCQNPSTHRRMIALHFPSFWTQLPEPMAGSRGWPAVTHSFKVPHQRTERSPLHQQARNNERSGRGNLGEDVDVSLGGSVSEEHSEGTIFGIMTAFLLKSQE